MLAPVVRAGSLASLPERVQRWTRQRMVPKVLVASQTRVLEAAVDPRGDFVGLTPVISVEPFGSAGVSGSAAPELPLEAVAAVISAPSSSARVAAVSAGTGRSTGSLRISASVLGSLPVPADGDSIDRLAEAWSGFEQAVAGERELLSVGEELDAALGVADPEVLGWWAERVGRRLRT